MDTPFIYNKSVSGKNFLGRKQNCTSLMNLLSQGENVSIYDVPKAGKSSLLQQTFLDMQGSGHAFLPINVSLFNVRSLAAAMTRIGSALIKAAANPSADYGSAVENLLPGTHFIFSNEEFYEKGDILSIAPEELDDNDIASVFSLPYRAGSENGRKLILILEEFQNIMLTEDGDRACTILENMFKELNPDCRRHACYIFCGSGVNAMKYIFEDKRYFYRQVEHIALDAVEHREIVDNCIKGYLVSGKVLDRDLMLGVCRLFKGNMWYINHFCSICDHLSKGYIMESVLQEALATLISLHEPRFLAMMNDLTTFQVSLLRAVLDGYKKFSSADVIREYGLNSSANVHRLKDALCKKEILTFDENDEPVILDPLFEYWAEKYFFEKSVE